MQTFKYFISEAGGAEAGKLEIVKTDLNTARSFAKFEMEKNSRKLEEEVPNFDKNYIFAQRLAKMGSTKRKDMPVISNKDVKLLQKRLKQGTIDISRPFSQNDVVDEPYPQGLTGSEAKQWLNGGLQQNDGDPNDDKVNVKMKQVAVGKLVPIQEQIYFDKSIRNVAKFGASGTMDFAKSKNNYYIVSKDNRIIDGHHRFLSAVLVDPRISVTCLEIDLSINNLLPMTLAYSDAIGNVRNR